MLFMISFMIFNSNANGGEKSMLRRTGLKAEGPALTMCFINNGEEFQGKAGSYGATARGGI